MFYANLTVGKDLTAYKISMAFYHVLNIDIRHQREIFGGCKLRMLLSKKK